MDENNAGDGKRGYLNRDFALFHLKDMKNISFEYHYHDFNKIVVFVSGNVTYLIEGTAYRLKPWDVLFVSSCEVHRAIIDPTVPYERIVIWVNPGFLERHSEECSLSDCFGPNTGKNGNLLRLDPVFRNEVALLLSKLEEAYRSDGFGSVLLKNALLLQLLVELTRKRLGGNGSDCSDIVIDCTIQKLLDYINRNIGGDLSIDSLASKFYMNRYHLMHKFKQQTGYTVHSYILQKRLIKADTLLRGGMTAAQASEQCGFKDYSSFSRAYGKMFGASPKKRRK
jgi:AraC-like DNA-binding protein/mannose-6-phosphate isomerase-like protein (cupin superfamily)